MSYLKEKTLSSEIKYNGYIINVRVDDVEISDGTKHKREVVEHSGGVVVIPILNHAKLVLIKQWRYPLNKELIELPAGKLEKNEDPFIAAKRELLEETGYSADNWTYVGYIYTAPGFCDEKLYFYKAENLKFKETNFDSGEIIEPYIINIDEANQLIQKGLINDAKTIIGMNYINI